MEKRKQKTARVLDSDSSEEEAQSTKYHNVQVTELDDDDDGMDLAAIMMAAKSGAGQKSVIMQFEDKIKKSKDFSVSKSVEEAKKAEKEEEQAKVRVSDALSNCLVPSDICRG